MALYNEQQVLFETGSFTGFRPLRELGANYLTTGPFKQPLCGNSEGWGPLSPHRYDFTPCFIDVWISAVSVFGLVFGSLAVWWLLAKKQKQEGQTKNAHFYIKQVNSSAPFSTNVLFNRADLLSQSLLAVIIVDVIAQLVVQIVYMPHIWYGDFRVLTTFLTILSLFVVFAIQWIEHSRIRYPSGVALFYWLFLLISFGVKLRSLISQQIYDSNLPYFVIYCVGVGLSLVEFLVEWLWPRTSRPSGYEAIEEEEECPVEYANAFSQLAFSWMTPMMQYGYKVYLTEEDLWALAKDDQTKNTGSRFDQAWQYELEHHKSPSLWRVLFKAYGGPYCAAAIFKVANDVAQYIQPQLLRLLISFVKSYEEDNTPQPIVKGAAIALAMFACAVLQTTMVHQYFQLAFVTGMRIKGGLSSAIYRKSLRLSSEGRASKSTGDIVNYMAVDGQRLQDLTQFAQQIWSAPFQIIICMVSLYNLLGWSMMAGVAVMIIMMPIQGFVARIMKNMQKEQMKNKDARSRLINEIINNMKSIKLYAWGSAFMNKLNFVRNEKELKNLRKIGATQAFANFTWTTAPFFVSCSTFTVFVLTQDKPLTSDIVFPALALFNLLTFPLAILPMVITSIVEASVAIGRLTSFLTAEELQPDAITIKPAPEQLGEESIIIRDGTFSWSRHENKPTLVDIDYTAYKGELSCVVGRVGAGKSSFLQSILGDMWKVKGNVEVRGTVAYASQQTWILNATVKENIIFGYKYDAEFYEKTVQACALLDDFAQLPDGDETVVGERGISLSGGQKARVSLARAVYARADIYLLDDVLSAVDSHVGRHIIDNVLGTRGLLASKTRILATNAIAVLRQASYVSLLKEGQIIERGTYKELVAQKGLVAELLKTAGHESGNASSEPSSSASSSKAATIIETDSGQAKEELEEAQEQVPEMAPIKTGAGAKPRSSSMATLRRASTASFRGPRGKLTDEEIGGSSKTKQAKEHLEQGKVKWSVYGEYAKMNNLYAVALYLLMLIAAQTAGIGGNFWLEKWSRENQEKQSNANVGKYLGIYFAFGIGASALTVIQTLVLWIFCSIEASRKLHERMANAIFRSPMSFFDTTPAGRILNRDIYRVDEVLARTFNMLFVNAAKSGFTLVVISFATPPFVALIIPLALTYYYIQRYYLRTSRELKRLDSVSRSPIYAHFQESLGGISTIRAFRQQQRFELENEWRVDANLRAYFPSISANRWLAVRLEFIGAVVILAAAGFAIIAVTGNKPIQSGIVGLAMSYALQITTSLNWIVRQTVEVETNIVSVERVLEYAALPSEAPEIIAKNRPPVSWPARGEVDFVNYSTRYREGLDLVLKNISLDIKSHEKIGVVGRTGAGKSSLTLALFRLIEPVTGHIGIDNIDTSSIGLLDLRRRLAIIPQDAALFEGTVRDNLDPGHVHDDTELWSVLEHARLKDHVSSMDGGLEAKINEGGSNLSQGQRQLVSLARAMLTPSNILVLDEATAAVDVETDAMLQSTLRSPLFANRTIITVAHRLNTILDSDRVVVLDKGEVVEFDSPAELFKKQGVFYGLMKQAGLEVE
ncbi:related to Ycf1p, Yor1p, rat organic anion transporter [Fusarium fujikuroi IMI 58289]|uniref:Related to Ycf1p, Yor1p, rat organic anion transporter n=1 Tax=Gibberella fujikuroi (strain CBS 195.34 / IMI 58289 / NRRL A-6831) TaxID=1279085 RepID=S0E8P2_GIBF5|nr:ATP-binding cassette transporter-like protein [Fusarium fujikuroi IMI 58289]CCT71244.1 related to Ycf1p, Yor1p, rat organic anion transporter [Fusarium fujikuroi IMI 58289]